MIFIARCVVHFDDISFGNLTDLRCSQGVFLLQVVWDIRPGDGLHMLLPWRGGFRCCAVFAYRLGFHTCRLSTVYTKVISIAFPKEVCKNLTIGWCAGLVIHQQVSIRFFGLFVICVHKVHFILSNMRSPIIPICFRSLGLRKRAKYSAFRLISILYFPSGNITLAFRWRPWVNSRDTTGLSVASAIKSSRMMMLLYQALISHRSSDSLGTPLSNRMLFPRDFFNFS